MRLLGVLVFLVGLPLSGVRPASAVERQAATSPEILFVSQEAVKPGKMAALTKNRAAVSRALEGANGPGVSIALTSISGPEEVWHLKFYTALGDWQKDREEVERNPELRAKLEKLEGQEGDLLTRKSSLTATYLQAVTYQPEFDWGQVRYLDVITVHVRPGHHLEYAELRKMSVAGHNKGGLEGPLHVFKVNTGTRGLTWMILRPLKSLHAHDDLRAKGFGEILTEEEDKKMVELRASSYEYAEERFFRVDPRMSHVPRAWDRPGEAFWNGRSK